MVDSHHDQSSSRKAKKPRVPKRGPGVAELEKILREQDQQQKNNGHHIDNKVSSSSISSLVHGNNINNIGNFGGRTSKGVYIGGSGVYLPEQSLLPISWKDQREPTSDFSFPVLTANGSDDHTKMMDFFKSSSTTGRVCNDQEPPSNQKHYTSTLGLEDQDKMKGAKRSRTNFPVENWRSPPSTPRTPYQPIRPMVSRLGSSSSSTNNGIFNLGISRDPLDHGNPNGNGSRNLITLGSPTTPLPSTHQNCEPDLFIKQFPFQENTEGSLLQRSSTETEVPVYNKSFVSFLLQPEDHQLQRGSSAEPTVCLKNEKRCNEKTEDFIDLDLKL